jgi:cytochrome d ubiquinol oxidase subunit I
LPFLSFRAMVGLGLLMIVVGAVGVVLWLRGRLDDTKSFHWLSLVMGPSGFIAVVTGWIVAEVGRQPYVVYGALRTSEAVSPVATGSVAFSLIVFMLVYAIVFTAGTLYIGRLLFRGPASQEYEPNAKTPPGSPLAALRTVDDANVSTQEKLA